jgi:hypothetical protein
MFGLFGGQWQWWSAEEPEWPSIEVIRQVAGPFSITTEIPSSASLALQATMPSG